MFNNKFYGKVAIITGSSRGIGKATAIEFVKNGALVVVNGRDQLKLTETEKIIQKLGGNVISVCCDISIPEQATYLVEKAINTYGKIDILVNNAAVSMRGKMAELVSSVYKTVFETNVLGTINTTIPAIPHLRKTRGSIVFISSVAGIRGLPGYSAYCASKMAMRAIAESLRIEEAKTGVHIGLIQVGITEIEPDKKIISADGNLVTFKNSSNLRIQKMEKVASAILKNIQNKDFITTLTNLGKLNAFLQSIMPNVVEKILIRSNKIIEKRSHLYR